MTYEIDAGNKELIDLVLQAKNGSEEAVNQILKRMENLVRRIANDNSCWMMGNGLGVDDLIQEGNIALVDAIYKFDPSFNKTFSMYAKQRIQAYVTYAIYNCSCSIKVPLLTSRKMRQIAADKDADMTEEELAEKYKISVSKVKKLLMKKPNICSMNELISEDEEGTYEYYIATEDHNPEEILTEVEFSDNLKGYLQELPEKERFIIESFYEMNDTQHLTLDELGKLYDCSSQNLYAMKNKILKKLKKRIEEEGKLQYGNF